MPMHVLVIASWYKTKARPLQGTFFEEQARALMKMGIKVTIFYPDIELKFSSRFNNISRYDIDYSDKGLSTYYLFVRSIIPRSRAINYWYLKIVAYRKIKKIIRIEGTPNIIHAHCVFNAGIVARFVSKRIDVPYLITEHFSGLSIGNVAKHLVNKVILRNVYKNATRVIMVSNYFKTDLLRKYDFSERNVVIVPNMVNNLFFKSLPLVKEVNQTILFSNSFINGNKNHKLQLDSFAILLKSKPDVILKIGGGGDLLPELRKYASSIGLNDEIVFLGPLSREDVRQNLSECSIFVSTSVYETFGVAIIEALAVGKPVVATNSGGPGDFIGEEDGILIESHDPVSFSQGIINILNNYHLYDSEVIRRRCFERFSECRIADNLISLYKTSIKR